MKIETTCMMHEEAIGLLKEAEQITGKKRIELVILAMRKMLGNHAAYIRKYNRVEYQKRFDNETGERIVKHRVKVRILEREYDYFQDMRKFFRRSISLIMAIAIKEYLHVIIDELLTGNNIDTNNYTYENYALIEKCIKNITTFHIWWGIPPKLKHLLR